MDAGAPNGTSLNAQRRLNVQRIPAKAGIGLRHPHVAELMESTHPISWLEIHSENYLCEGGPRLAALQTLRDRYPISCHGVGLSLGSADGLDGTHLRRLRALFDWLDPGLVSEHVAWSVTDGTYLNDLLPLPYTEEALAVLCRNVETAQQCFSRQILVENPSSYVTFPSSTFAEWDFLAELVRRTGCGLLLDINNIYVSAQNEAYDANTFLNGFPLDAVRELHLAGHLAQTVGEETVLIDDHGAAVSHDVWHLFGDVLARTGPVPTLIEWDTNIPSLTVLVNEAAQAQRMLDGADAAPPQGAMDAA